MLKTRILSAVIAIPILIIILKIGNIPFLLLNLVVVGLGMDEYYKLVKAKGIKANRFLGILIGLILVLLTYLNSNDLSVVYGFLILSFLVILLKQVIVGVDNSAIFTTAITFFGVFYVAGLFSHLILLYNLELSNGKGIGTLFVWLPILATWITDTGAYFTGMNFGKSPLAPKISPKKTIEGAVGGLTFSIALTMIISVYLGFGYLHGIVLGILIALFAQLGDLSESVFKRDANIKDSGDIIPGHGGILDRIDSLLFTLPVVYYYLQWVVLR
ncbi:phosphatidate cytidylyltransferase [Orenia metallireducens]|jgi:phosphatidate cytidylyltransferase|uniref:Phosphatidate cytidylyltransferase n=1 Tax=Orenia metallireducens TaxID=1413210 RepID=A0A285FMY9_9FIRM|nr:phosphatidate cytidylyltransferase [Orenia metallireducens]PRX33638.1 phosphatidate cytidylyltransferase [Orenia metallireducens]SNY12558.1 phosphatidate cytidylyltransferase [Orenia metallireducens]